MSSELKDARWYLAQSMVYQTGLEWEDLDYETHDHLLKSADLVLSKVNRGNISLLAHAYNSHDPDYYGYGMSVSEIIGYKKLEDMDRKAALNELARDGQGSGMHDVSNIPTKRLLELLEEGRREAENDEGAISTRRDPSLRDLGDGLYAVDGVRRSAVTGRYSENSVRLAQELRDSALKNLGSDTCSYCGKSPACDDAFPSTVNPDCPKYGY